MAELVCPCDVASTPLAVYNPPGLSRIDYRVGTFLSIRSALLRALPNEQALTSWRPSASADLALQMVEWWAYLSDILTFYNERIANQAYLRTADLPESLRNVVRLLGYRPRPGIAAHGYVAAQITGSTPFVLPAGFALDSKPGPGQDPQTFELDQDTPLATNDTVPAKPPEFLFWPSANQFLIQGKSTQVTVGAILLVASLGGAPLSAQSIVKVTDVAVELNPDQTKQTRVTFEAFDLDNAPPPDLPASQVRIRTANRTALLADQGVLTSTVSLSGVERQIGLGEPVVFVQFVPRPRANEKRIGPPPFGSYLSIVEGLQDVPFFLPQADPPPNPAPPQQLGGFQTQLTLADDLSTGPTKSWRGATTTVQFGWQDIPGIINQPATAMPVTNSADPTALLAVAPAQFTESAGTQVLLEDASGAGAQATASSGDGKTLSAYNLTGSATSLSPPINVLSNLLSVSRGKTVSNEVLGSGDASIAGQVFFLKKSPVTYLDPGDGLVSTVGLRVNGRLWTEAPSFYGQPADAEIFVTAEDEAQKTRVTFGDGINGARLPTGTNNVTATYRYGSGQAAPLPGQLTVVTKPYPNLRAIRNPVAMGGGADPDPPEQIRRYAPRSVLTFGRAVSGDDYEVIASQAPSVTRAKSYWSFSTTEQRAAVRVYVGDTKDAVDSARSALVLTSDPNRPVEVLQATPLRVRLAMRALIDPRYLPQDVQGSIERQLCDAAVGLFGSSRLGIGAPIFDSEIDEACLAVPGCIAVHALTFLLGDADPPVQDPGPRHFPAEGGYFVLTVDELSVSMEVSDHAG